MQKEAKVNKRPLIGLVVIYFLAAFSIAGAEQPKKSGRIGVLTSSTPASTAAVLKAFREGLRDLGYVEGQSITIENRYAEGKLDRLPKLIEELIELNVEVIVVSGQEAVRVAKKATKTIPIIMTVVQDPVASGLVDSLAHPGGNITGITNLAQELSGKRLELLKEAFPKLSRVAVLWQPDAPGPILTFKDTQVAARALGLELESLEVRSANDFDNAFKTAIKGRAGALIVLQSLLTVSYREQILKLAAKHRLAGMYTASEFVEAGGLMSYAPSYTEIYRRAAVYVDKILKGAKPANLPVEQPTKFEFVINLKTAKQIGLTIPPNVLARADKIIK
jgi:putative ABC transport system substrate-binding protein